MFMTSSESYRWWCVNCTGQGSCGRETAATERYLGCPDWMADRMYTSLRERRIQSFVHQKTNNDSDNSSDHYKFLNLIPFCVDPEMSHQCCSSHSWNIKRQLKHLFKLTGQLSYKPKPHSCNRSGCVHSATVRIRVSRPCDHCCAEQGNLFVFLLLFLLLERVPNKKMTSCHHACFIKSPFRDWYSEYTH